MGLPSRFEGLVMKINIYGYFMQYLEWFLTFSKASIEYLVKKPLLPHIEWNSLSLYVICFNESNINFVVNPYYPNAL